MNRLALLAAGVAAAGLAACTSNRYYGEAAAPRAAAAPVVNGKPIVYAPAQSPTSTVLTSQTTTFRAGPGTVESVSLVHIVPPGTLTSSASTGATLPGSQSAYRVTVRMDDGTYQAVDQDNRGFMVGDRVSFAADGNLTKQ
ncbi:MAG TPA: hypothetical protein VF262_11185 [Burkholderiales bacterium]|jgi:hypothetical protein